MKKNIEIIIQEMLAEVTLNGHKPVAILLDDDDYFELERKLDKPFEPHIEKEHNMYIYKKERKQFWLDTYEGLPVSRSNITAIKVAEKVSVIDLSLIRKNI